MDVEDAQYCAKKMQRATYKYTLFDFNKKVEKIKAKSDAAYNALLDY